MNVSRETKFKVICRKCGSCFEVIRVSNYQQVPSLARVDDRRVCPAYCTTCGGRVLEKINE